MARAMGVSLRTVQRIWTARKLQPHRIRSFKRSHDPDFAAKLEDIVGLYMAPPKDAIVLSVDEKSQIQALDRTQPGLPLKPGKAGTDRHPRRAHQPAAVRASSEPEVRPFVCSPISTSSRWPAPSRSTLSRSMLEKLQHRGAGPTLLNQRINKISDVRANA
jgi:hypothetical protein